MKNPSYQEVILNVPLNIDGSAVVVFHDYSSLFTNKMENECVLTNVLLMEKGCTTPRSSEFHSKIWVGPAP